jgi:hypothetical protein
MVNFGRSCRAVCQMAALSPTSVGGIAWGSDCPTSPPRLVFVPCPHCSYPSACKEAPRWGYFYLIFWDGISLYSTGWPQICNPPASASRGLGSGVCPTSSSHWGFPLNFPYD